MTKRAKFAAMAATAIVGAIGLSAEGALVVAGNNLVNLRADNATAGTDGWTNTGTLGGSFTKGGAGNTTVTNNGGVSYVPLDGTTFYVGPNAPAGVTGAG